MSKTPGNSCPNFPHAAPLRYSFASCLSLGLILGLQPRLIGLDKLTKLGGVGEQRVPLLQVEGDRESTETVHGNTPFLRHLKLRLLPLARRPSNSAIRVAICSGVRFVFVSSAIV